MSNFCSNCGSELNDSKFCPNCGSSVSGASDSGNNTNTSAAVNNASTASFPTGKPKHNVCDWIIMLFSAAFIILSCVSWFSVTIPFDESHSFNLFSLNGFISALDSEGSYSFITTIIVIAAVISIAFSALSILQAFRRKRAFKCFFIASTAAAVAAIVALCIVSVVKGIIISELEDSGAELFGEMLTGLFSCTFAPKLLTALGLIGAFLTEYGFRFFATELGDVPSIGSNLSRVSSVEGLSDIKGKTYKSAYCSPNDTKGVYTATLNKRYARFKCFAYVPSNCQSSGFTEITITSDGKELYTQAISKEAQRVHINLNISGCVHFEIKADGNICYIGDPKFYQ